MNVLLIHGVNTDETANPNPYDSWIAAITNGLQAVNYPSGVNPTRFNYNALFDQYDNGPGVYGAAVAELLASAAWHALTAPQTAGVAAAPAPAQPGPGFSSEIEWTAGMVAQWVVEDDLRKACRDQLYATIQNTNPDVIFAHSLGSLLCYDLLVNDARGKSAFLQGTFVTFGSQIANPFVQDRMWNGQVEMPPVARWINLYNPHDPVFVASIDVAATSFYQFVPVFGGMFFDVSAHEVTTGSGHPGYLDNPTTDQYLWPLLAGSPMAMQIERNLRIAKRIPKTLVGLESHPKASLSFGGVLQSRHSNNDGTGAAPAQSLYKKVRKKHHYRYHLPRAQHPLLKSAPHAVMLAATPPSVDLRGLCLPIRDQGSEGACSGFATAAFRETSYTQATGNRIYLSPAFLYWQTRTDDHTFPADSGASIADEFTALVNDGVCPESDLPYNADPTEAATPNILPLALPYRLPQPIQVNFANPQVIKSVLASNQTITIGFWVYDSFENPASGGVLSLPNTTTENMLGGHGVLLCGYDDVNSWWIIRNQWGPAWGDRGYCYMPYGYESVWTEAWSGVPAGLVAAPTS